MSEHETAAGSEQAAGLEEVLKQHRDCGMWMPVERRRWRFPCGVEIVLPEDLTPVSLSDIDRVHVATAVREHYRASLDAAREDALRQHREDWASWLENWSGAVCPEPPTIAAVIGWLRADHLPFGCFTSRLTPTGHDGGTT